MTDKFTLHHGDCLAILATLPDCSVDAIVTDPPAGIAFMGKAWDRDKGGKTEWVRWMQSVAAQCLRVIKPGGHALVWAIPRTSHWTGDAWEEAGWQVRDKIYHVFGSGFPKSLDVSKAIDKAAGAEREVGPKRVSADGTVAHDRAGARHEGYERPWRSDPDAVDRNTRVSYPATPAAKQWAGWGTALKPAAEEWWLFRRPLEGTVAANVLKHGTGAINVDGCRVGFADDQDRAATAAAEDFAKSRARGTSTQSQSIGKESRGGENTYDPFAIQGRWPANFTHDGSDEVTALLGDAARFYYSPKASKTDRDEGCEGLPLQVHQSGMGGAMPIDDDGNDRDRFQAMSRNFHPTVKPVDLMTYLCRLITPPGGTILDPFTGSGSTGKAAILEDFKFIGIEREAEYIEIARARIEAAVEHRAGFLF